MDIARLKYNKLLCVNLSRRRTFALFSVTLFILLYSNLPTPAQVPFHQGKKIEILVGFSAGGPSDQYSRIYARHLERHIPGNPTVVVLNMAGAGGLLAANELFKNRKPDSLTIGMISRPQILAQLIRNPIVQFDARKFEWLGAPTREEYFCVIKKEVGIESVDSWAVSKKSLKIGALSEGSMEFLTAKLLQKQIGTPLQIVPGFGGTSQMLLASERGEIDGACGIPKSSIASIASRPTAKQNLNIIPLSRNLVKTDAAKRSLALIEQLGITAFSYALPPGTPKERTDILRRAFQDIMKDPKFLADIKEARLDINPLTGEDIRKSLGEVFEQQPMLLASLDTRPSGGGSGGGGGSGNDSGGGRSNGGANTGGTAISDIRTGKPYWNTWIEDGRLAKTHITPREEGYTFVLDISRYQYDAHRSTQVDSDLSRRIKNAQQKKERTLELVIRPVLVGGELEIASKDLHLEHPLTINLDRLLHDSKRAEEESRGFAALRKGPIDTELPKFASSVQAGVVKFRIFAKRPGCGTIALSIWDERGTSPLDHLMYTIDVREKDDKPPNCTSSLRGGVASMLDIAIERRTNQSSMSDAALHIFEIPHGTQKKSIAVFVDGTEYEKLRKNRTEVSFRTNGVVFNWVLKSVLSDYLTDPGLLFRQVMLARNKAKQSDRQAYSQVANQLAAKIFSAEDGVQAEQALQALQSLVKKSTTPPTLLARLHSVDKQPFYIPLGLLSAAGANILSQPIRVVQPLPRERYVTGDTCIQSWTFGIPNQLDEVGQISLGNNFIGSTPTRENWIRSFKSLETYFDQKNNKNKSEAAEGLVLLAHHYEGNLWFVEKEGQIIREQVTKTFPPGSIAILSACAAGNPKGNNRAILDDLNKNGIDSLIVSPFQIRADYGKWLAINFTKVIRDPKNIAKQATLLELFDQATALTAKQFPKDHKFDDMGLEFLIVGDPRLRLCKQ